MPSQPPTVNSQESWVHGQGEEEDLNIKKGRMGKGEDLEMGFGSVEKRPRRDGIHYGKKGK